MARRVATDQATAQPGGFLFGYSSFVPLDGKLTFLACNPVHQTCHIGGWLHGHSLQFMTVARYDRAFLFSMLRSNAGLESPARRCFSIDADLARDGHGDRPLAHIKWRMQQLRLAAYRRGDDGGTSQAEGVSPARLWPT
jgi:hypothetical protein